MPNFLSGKTAWEISRLHHFRGGHERMTTNGVFWQLESPRKFTQSDIISLGFKSSKLSKGGRGKPLRFVMAVAKWERSAT